MVAAVFAKKTVVVAAVVSGPAVWVHHACSAHRDRLLQSSSAFLASLALRVMPYVAALLHIWWLSHDVTPKHFLLRFR